MFCVLRRHYARSNYLVSVDMDGSMDIRTEDLRQWSTGSDEGKLSGGLKIILLFILVRHQYIDVSSD